MDRETKKTLNEINKKFPETKHLLFLIISILVALLLYVVIICLFAK